MTLADRIVDMRDAYIEQIGKPIELFPKGEILVQASQTAEEVRIKKIDLNLARDKMITTRNNILADRRPEEYSLLTEK